MNEHGQVSLSADALAVARGDPRSVVGHVVTRPGAPSRCDAHAAFRRCLPALVVGA